MINSLESPALPKIVTRTKRRNRLNTFSMANLKNKKFPKGTFNSKPSAYFKEKVRKGLKIRKMTTHVTAFKQLVSELCKISSPCRNPDFSQIARPSFNSKFDPEKPLLVLDMDETLIHTKFVDKDDPEGFTIEAGNGQICYVKS